MINFKNKKSATSPEHEEMFSMFASNLTSRIQTVENTVHDVVHNHLVNAAADKFADFDKNQNASLDGWVEAELAVVLEKMLNNLKNKEKHQVAEPERSL